MVFGEPLGGEGWSGVDEGGAVGLHVDLLSNSIIFHFSIINWRSFGEWFWREWGRGIWEGNSDVFRWGDYKYL